MSERWLVCDYGEVLSTAPPESEWDELRELAGGRPQTEFHRIYWEHRPAYDRADVDAEEFWRSVLGRPASPGELADLVEADCRIWLHCNEPSTTAALAAASRGYRLALFSNAPMEVGHHIDALEWLEPFEPRFFSWRLRAVKPEAAAYGAVLASLGVAPGQVVFVDDRPPNVDAARRLGIDGRLFSGPEVFSELL